MITNKVVHQDMFPQCGVLKTQELDPDQDFPKEQVCPGVQSTIGTKTDVTGIDVYTNTRCSSKVEQCRASLPQRTQPLKGKSFKKRGIYMG